MRRFWRVFSPSSNFSSFIERCVFSYASQSSCDSFFFFSFLCLDCSPLLWHQINKEMHERLIQRARSLASFTRRVDFWLPMCAGWELTTNCFIEHAHWVLLPLDWLGHWYPLASETQEYTDLGSSTYINL